jgi:membrane protease YdiL (CAAX protease family)
MAGRLVQTRAALLVALIFMGSLVLALVVPGAALWAVSQLGQGKQESFYLAMLGCPLAVIGWAAVLGRLNLAYKATTGRRDDDVLGVALALAVMVAVAVVIAMVATYGGHDPGNAGPWPG